MGIENAETGNEVIEKEGIGKEWIGNEWIGNEGIGTGKEELKRKKGEISKITKNNMYTFYIILTKLEDLYKNKFSLKYFVKYFIEISDLEPGLHVIKRVGGIDVKNVKVTQTHLRMEILMLRFV